MLQLLLWWGAVDLDRPIGFGFLGKEMKVGCFFLPHSMAAGGLIAAKKSKKMI